MPTLEQLALALDAVRNLQNLRRDIVANADDYEARLAAGHTEEQVLDVAKRNASEYKRRTDWHAEKDVDNDVREAMTALGVTDYDDELTDLTAKANALLNPTSIADAITGARNLTSRKEFFKPRK